MVSAQRTGYNNYAKAVNIDNDVINGGGYIKP